MEKPTQKPMETKKTLDPSLLPTKIQYVTVFSNDSKKSRDFYKEVFGLKADYEDPSDAWIELKPDRRLTEPQKEKALTTFSIHSTGTSEHKEGQMSVSVFVPDLAKYHEYLVGRGDVEVISPPKKQEWGGEKADYKAPDGAQFSAVEVKPKPLPGCGICHFDIPVSDMDRAKKFYTDVFGWSFTDFRPGEYSMFNPNSSEYDLQGGLTKESANITYPGSYLHVTDIEDALEKIKKHGGHVVKTKSEIGGGVGSFAHFKDTEGNVMALYSR